MQGFTRSRKGHIRRYISGQHHYRLTGFVINCRYTLLHNLGNSPSTSEIITLHLRDASRAGQTPSQFDDKTRGVIAYRALLKHVLTRQLAPQVA